MGRTNLAPKILAVSWPRIFALPGHASQKILKIESLRLAKTHFRHEKYEHRYSVIRYWMWLEYIKNDFECTTHFLSIFTSKILIGLRFTTRDVFFFSCFFGLSIPPKMSVSEIKTTFLVFNSKWTVGPNIKTIKWIKYHNYHSMCHVSC